MVLHPVSWQGFRLAWSMNRRQLNQEYKLIQLSFFQKVAYVQKNDGGFLALHYHRYGQYSEDLQPDVLYLIRPDMK